MAQIWHNTTSLSSERRRGWDSNPRTAKGGNLISSQARYNHFGTSPIRAVQGEKNARII